MNQPLSNNSNLSTDLQRKKPLGELLVEAGLISIHQIEIALQEQKHYSLRIGEILASHGWIKQETANFFAEKWTNLIQQQPTRPLALYLFAAALLDKEQLLILKQKQRQANGNIKLHYLAVEQGYVKQITVDFFLKYLFNIRQDSVLSFAKPYEIIKNYLNGETNFQNIELSQAPLSGVSLKQIILDDSNLKQANLNNSNLSHSSLIRVNLSLANLESANLSHTNFKDACLIEANLRQGNLEHANFQAANLQEADLRGANLDNAIFAGADLRGAKLESTYAYDVYYDNQTCFNANFEPVKAGWRAISSEQNLISS